MQATAMRVRRHANDHCVKRFHLITLFQKWRPDVIFCNEQ